MAEDFGWKEERSKDRFQVSGAVSYERRLWPRAFNQMIN